MLLESWVLIQSIIHKSFKMVFFKWVSKDEGEDYIVDISDLIFFFFLIVTCSNCGRLLNSH
jgi:hypothetical protein